VRAVGGGADGWVLRRAVRCFGRAAGCLGSASGVARASSAAGASGVAGAAGAAASGVARASSVPTAQGVCTVSDRFASPTILLARLLARRTDHAHVPTAWPAGLPARLSRLDVPLPSRCRPGPSVAMRCRTSDRDFKCKSGVTRLKPACGFVISWWSLSFSGGAVLRLRPGRLASPARAGFARWGWLRPLGLAAPSRLPAFRFSAGPGDRPSGP